MNQQQPFEFEYGDQTVVIKPKGQLTSLAYSFEEYDVAGFLAKIQRAGFKNVLVDFTSARAIGSSLLGALTKISSIVREQDGQMAVCNVSTGDRQVLEISHLDELWQVYETREDALDAIGA